MRASPGPVRSTSFSGRLHVIVLSALDANSPEVITRGNVVEAESNCPNVSTKAPHGSSAT